MDSARSTRALPRVGFPIRRSRDQRLVSTSPALIAAAHVLHRLLAPRHPPCALVLLIEKNTLCAAMEFSRCTWTGAHEKTPNAAGGLSKLSSMQTSRSTWFLGESSHRTADSPSTGSAPTGVRAPAFPRKEVIQPQLPLRLPCYDFTPIIDPTFDGSLPQGVRPPASGVADFRGVTGGVYKARERIHRGNADPRLLATPPSWRRVSASNPNRDRLFGIRSPSRVCSPLYRPM